MSVKLKWYGSDQQQTIHRRDNNMYYRSTCIAVEISVATALAISAVWYSIGTLDIKHKKSLALTICWLHT